MNKDLFKDFDCWSVNEEVFDSSEDIIYYEAEAYLGEWITIWAGNQVKIKPSDLVSNTTVATIVENMFDVLYDEVEEVACDRLVLPEDKRSQLEDYIEDFMDKHCEISCYTVDNSTEFKVRLLEEGGDLEVKTIDEDIT